MAVIKKESYYIDGVEFEVKLKCNSKGVFSADLDRRMSTATGLDTTVTASTLLDLQGKLRNAVKDYQEAALKYDVFLCIGYEASGPYAIDRETKRDLHFGSIPSLGFRYQVLVRESGGAKNIWTKSAPFEASTAERYATYNRKYPDVGFGFTTGSSAGYGDPSGKLIPYSVEAEEALETAVNNLAQLSKLIHGFYTQDEEAINRVLISGSFLALPTGENNDQ